MTRLSIMYMIRRFSQPLCIINHHSFIVLRIIALVTCKNKLYILFTKNNIAVVSFLKAIPQKGLKKIDLNCLFIY